MVMYKAKDPKQRYTIVDLDPYGSPADFLDSAVQSVEDGGLLAVTCTDLGVLCGNHGETCFAKYGTMPIKGARYCHEQALRIALASIQQHASRYKRYIVPLVSIYVDFYVRMFVRVYTSPQEVKQAGAKVSHVYQCTQCDSYHLAPLAKITGEAGHLKFAPGSGPPVNMTCAECNSVFKIGGPVWSEPIHNAEFLSRALQHLGTEESKQMYKTHKRIFGLLSVASEELPDVPFFYVVSSLANTLRLSCPPIMPLRSALVNAGYRVSLSHCEPNSLKTNAPTSFIWDMMRAWNLKQDQEHQVKLDKLSDTSPAKLILSKAPTANIDFTANKDAESKSQNLPRYLPNPSKYIWCYLRSTAIDTCHLQPRTGVQVCVQAASATLTRWACKRSSTNDAQRVKRNRTRSASWWNKAFASNSKRYRSVLCPDQTIARLILTIEKTISPITLLIATIIHFFQKHLDRNSKYTIIVII